SAAPALWLAQREPVAPACRTGDERWFSHPEPSDTLTTILRVGVERDFREPQHAGERHWKADMGSGLPVWRCSVGDNQRNADGGASGLRMRIHEHRRRIRRIVAEVCAAPGSCDGGHELVRI